MLTKILSILFGAKHNDDDTISNESLIMEKGAGFSPPPQNSPDGKDLAPLIFSLPLPFYCKHAVRRCKDGFYIDGKLYRNTKDLKYKESGQTPHPENESVQLKCYLDKYGKCVIHCCAEVPQFDSSDALDCRCWEWFYFVDDFKKKNPFALVCFFGDQRDDKWSWFVYDNMRNQDGTMLTYKNLIFHPPLLPGYSFSADKPRRIIPISIDGLMVHGV